MRRRFFHPNGQALVEFALAATLIFLLLAAAVDLGMIYFSVQGLHNSAQEGANYGSRWLITQNGKRVLNEAEIRKRARLEAGSRGGVGFVNLLDLNSNDIDDVTGNEQVNGKPLINEYITVQALSDPDNDGNPLRDGNDNRVEIPCNDIADSNEACYIRVVVEMDYNLVFALSPAFGDKIRLRSSYVMPLRDTVAEGGSPDPNRQPVFEPATRVPTPTNLIVDPTSTPQPCEYSPTNGIVAMQADAYMNAAVGSAGDSWTTVNDNSASGDTALQAGPDNGTITNATDGPRLDYTVNFDASGTYTVYVLGKAPNNNGNSIHVGLNGTQSGTISNVPRNRWGWQSVTVTVSSPGPATLNIWMREDGVMVDRIIASSSSLNTNALNGTPDSSEPACAGSL